MILSCNVCEHHGQGCGECPSQQKKEEPKKEMVLKEFYRQPDGRINIGSGEDCAVELYSCQ